MSATVNTSHNWIAISLPQDSVQVASCFLSFFTDIKKPHLSRCQNGANAAHVRDLLKKLITEVLLPGQEVSTWGYKIIWDRRYEIEKFNVERFNIASHSSLRQR